MSGIDPQLFPDVAREPQEPCPQCGAALQLRRGRGGLFWGCSSYPACSYLKPLVSSDFAVFKVLTAPCPECQAPLAVRQGRFGLFIGCSNFPACGYHTSGNEQPAAAMACPLCGQGQLVKRLSRYGKAFWGCDAFPVCNLLLKGEPVAGPCPLCQAPTLEVRRTGGKLRHHCVCPGCGYSSEPL